MAARSTYAALLGLSAVAASSALVVAKILPNFTVQHFSRSHEFTFFSLRGIAKLLAIATVPPALAWVAIVAGLIFSPSVQRHAVYMHKIISTPRGVDEPERFGFLPRQVVPFNLEAEDGERIAAWLVTPPGLYHSHQDEITSQTSHAWKGGMATASSATKTVNFELLRSSPTAKLVIFMHGNAGTMGSGWRPAGCRALSSLAPDDLHVLTFDYRGFGLSTGSPSQGGLLLDAAAAFRWATEAAGVPPSRVVLLGQSLGAGAAMQLAAHLSGLAPTPVSPAGVVTVGAFTDVVGCLTELWVEGLVPLLRPLAWCPPLLRLLARRLPEAFPNTRWAAELVRRAPAYHLTFLHAEDDQVLPPRHADALFSSAVGAAVGGGGLSAREVEEEKGRRRVGLGRGGWAVEWRTDKGLIREERPVYGRHDTIVSYPITVLAVMRAFEAAEGRGV